MKYITKSPKETQKLGHFLFNKISLTTEKNALVVALEGELGAGKTTLIKLLCGFYKPTKGEILFNGINIHEYDLKE